MNDFPSIAAEPEEFSTVLRIRRDAPRDVFFSMILANGPVA
jgi:hypothetical protein